MPAKARVSTQLPHLKALADSPREQLGYALELLHSSRERQVIQAALKVLIERGAPREARPLLLERFAYYDADGVRRDVGGTFRAAILEALRPIARQDDVPLLERAAATYEFLPPNHSEEARGLRAAALVALDELDSGLAGYHCVRLLADPHTSCMSGEPALTAARVLASRGHLLPLYSYAVHGLYVGADCRHSEVLSECLKSLAEAPASLLPGIVEKYRDTEDEIVLVGLYDLVLAVERADFVLDFLRAPRRYAAYRYLVTQIVAARAESLWPALTTVAREEQDRRKLEILLEAVRLPRPSPALRELIGEVEARLGVFY